MAYSVTHFSKQLEEKYEGGTGGRIEGGKLHGADGHGQERGIEIARTVAGFVADGTKIDRAEAVGVSYPGFFQQMEGLGARVQMG
jgi:5-enolpyruvylshikimate-3-phosphate synthase